MTKSETVNKAQRRGTLTLKDVALVAGVTPMTVSNVLNGRDSQVGAKTRERVRAAIEQLGYRPHAAARQLRSQRTNALGMLVLDDVPQFLNDPFTTQVVAGLSNVATENDYSVVLQGVRSDNMLDAPLLAQLRTDGVCAILSGPRDRRRALIERLINLRVPLVLVQEAYDHADVCTVRQDDHRGASQIAEYLVAQGARRMMFLRPAERWPAMSERIRGTQNVCDRHGASLTIVACGDESLAATQAAVAEAIDAEGLPDAIVGGNDRMAMAALKLLAQRGIKVPDDLRVTGFNSFDFAAYAVPSLVTVRSDAYAMGYRAGAELLRTIETGAFSTRDIVLPVSFVPGQSA
ncbi:MULTISPECIES: LacI family DNA-binding transcriptional regulator [unclassified Roseitalea]|uniref:LacI family DNA-binding transcriptional regulator n=1 Tax=unclassified Roseitalea TaxID=2639107 RepID=UPI00273E3527|nr:MULTISPECIES: LacI family DNA-binding transcriptional regulator [unclassified Roseitalea]